MSEPMAWQAVICTSRGEPIVWKDISGAYTIHKVGLSIAQAGYILEQIIHPDIPKRFLGLFITLDAAKYQAGVTREEPRHEQH